MRTITLPLLAIIALTACTSQEERQLQAAQALIKTQLRDPDSAQFDCSWRSDHTPSQAERYASKEPILECDVRAKNGFGGYGRPGMDRDAAEDYTAPTQPGLALWRSILADCSSVSAYATRTPRSAPPYQPQPIALQKRSSAIWRV